mgnify:CR=1 FL=1
MLLISFITLPLYKGCNIPVNNTVKCEGYKVLHPYAFEVYCYTDRELYKLEEEKDPDIRIKKFIIRFGLLPLRKGKTVFEELQDTFHIPPAIKAAQAIMESALGRTSGMSKLAIRANNYHGIKAKGKENSISLQTIEYRKGKKQNELAYFAKYETPYLGMKAHARLLAEGGAYRKFQRTLIPSGEYYCMLPERRLEYIEYLINEMGRYATSPTYKKDVMKTVKKYSLHLL